jgi:hypothetical protein
VTSLVLLGITLFVAQKISGTSFGSLVSNLFPKKKE